MYPLFIKKLFFTDIVDLLEFLCYGRFMMMNLEENQSADNTFHEGAFAGWR